MLQALQKYSSTSDDFPPPAPDPDIASLPPVLLGNWNTDPSQGVHDILYWVDKNNPRAPHTPGPSSDPQFAYWDYPVQVWAQQNPALLAGAQPNLNVPTQTPLTPATSLGGFQITSPQSGAPAPFGIPVKFAVADSGPMPIVNVSYYVNGVLVGTVGAPYVFSYLPQAQGLVTLHAVAIHPDGSSAGQTITFTVQ
jgi:hypothetical protein